jgi:hypothetical protein
MWFRMAFLFVVLIVFAASVRSVAQSSSSPSLLAVCEGDGCSLWEFNGGHATGTFPDGVVANLTIDQFPKSESGTVTIRRVDTSGVGSGIVGTYTGTRQDSMIQGTISWTWPGHPDGKGDWIAVILTDTVHTVPVAAHPFGPIPSSLSVCEDGHGCSAWTLNGKTGAIPGLANLTVERFDDTVIAIRRQEVAGALKGIETLYVGLRRGNRVDGVATWKWSGQPPVGILGWHATVPTAAAPPSQVATNQPTPAAPSEPRQGLPMGMSPQVAPGPPQKLRFCAIGEDDKHTTVCENLTWARDHYDGVVDGTTQVAEKFTITKWDRVVMLDSTPMSPDGKEMHNRLLGTIAETGDRIDNGALFGNGFEAGTFSATWKAGSVSSSAVAFLRAAEAKEAADAKDQRRRINGIVVPAGAADIFATYPDDVRAILLPEHELSWQDAVRPCDAEKEDKVNGAGTDIKDGVLSLEIGRFALRRGEFARGFCWINHSAYLTQGNPRPMVILGILNLMGWYFPKNPQRAFHYFDGEFQTHDAWALYFVEQCYINGTGVAKNIPRAGQIDSYLMTHDDGQAVFKMIGADDENVQYRAERLKALMTDHSETAKETCKTVPVAGTGTVRQECTTSPISDDGKALQRDLDAIDKKHPDQSKPQQ